MYRFAANLASKARVAKNSAQQGRNVMIEQSYGASKVNNVGESLVKQVANATNGVAGDGTACASVFTGGIFSKGSNSVAAGMNAMDKRFRINVAIDSVDDSVTLDGAGNKKDRFMDAFNANKAAVQLGIVPGGSVGLYASKNLATANFHQNIGLGIIQSALQMPMRGYASNAAGVGGEANLKSTLRPLSPHLPIYTPQLSSTFSIFHRITGAFLSTMVLSFYLITMKMGSVCLTYESFYQFLFYSSKLALLSAEISALALAYHVFNGFRHLYTDYAGFPIFGTKSGGSALKAIARKGH